MPIQSENIKFFRSAVMDRSATNGGMPSSTVIVDGGSNQILPDISELDRAAGDVQFAKLYPAVVTSDVAALYGASVVVAEPPTDAATTVVMLQAASVTETQADVIARLGGVSGALTDAQRSKISTGAYLIKAIGPGRSYNGITANNVWSDATHEILTTPTAGAHGAYALQVNADLLGVALTHFVPGMTLTLVDWYNGAVVKVEALTIAKVVKNAAVGLVVLEFDADSAYGSAWGEANSYWGAVGGSAPYGTYIVEADITAGLSKARFFGSSRLTASASPASRIIHVGAVKAGVVPAALATSPEAEGILGFKPGLLTKAIDGQEPIFEVGRFAVLGKNVVVGPATYANGATVNFGETAIKRVKAIGANGQPIASGWTADLDAGTVAISNVSGWSQPVTWTARVEDMAMITAIDGTDITLGRDLAHSYPSGASVSAALILGDVRARVTATFDQATWGGTWADDTSDGISGAAYNTTQYPIVVTNDGAITERWRIQFTSPSAFTVTGEHVGQIATGNTSADCAPVNPATGHPYFTLPAAGWGAGWSPGNVLRINTQGAAPPVWLIRCIQQSADASGTWNFEIALRGGVDRP